MEKLYSAHKSINRGIVFLSFSLFCGQQTFGFFKDEQSHVQNESTGGYLAFHSPPKLAFSPAPPIADRTFLLRLGLPTNLSELPPEVDTNVTEQTDFPLVSYTDSETNQSAIYQIPQNSQEPVPAPSSSNLLPPADPFVAPQPTNYDSINNTDELMRVFEEGMSSGRSTSASGFQFLPPYTVERGNMLMSSKATYTRKQRN